MSPELISQLFSTGVALLAFGATYWPAELGSLAASPGILVIALAVLCMPFCRKQSRPLFTALKLRRLLWTPVLGSLISIAVFGWDPLYVGKFFSLGLLSLIWLSPLLLADSLNIQHIERAAVAGLLICIVAYVFSDLSPGGLPSSIKGLVFGGGYDDYTDHRPRGFSEEPSQFSALVARYVIVLFLIRDANRPYKSTRLVTLLVTLSIALVGLSSKGAVAGIALALLSFTIGRRQLPYLLLLAPLSWWLVNTQLESLSVDIEQFTSTSTRIGMTLTGLSSVVLNPLGYGYYGFYGAVRGFGNWSIDWLTDRLPLLMSEMSTIVDDLTNVSTKSTPFDFAMVFGWLFIWMLVRIGLLINLRDPRARATFVFLLASSLSTSGHLSITFFLGLTVLLKLYPRIQHVPAEEFHKTDLSAKFGELIP